MSKQAKIQALFCMNDGCDYTADIEPDSEGGYCEECGTESVNSIAVIMGVI